MALLPKPATGFGEIQSGNRFSWRFPQKKRRLRQNPRLSTRVGKFEWEAVYLGDFSQKSGSHAKTGHLGPAWENSSGNRLSWRLRNNAEWRNSTATAPFAIPAEKRRSSLHTPPPSHCLRLDKFAQTTTIRQRGVESLLPPRPSSFWDRRYVHSQFELGSRATDRA